MDQENENNRGGAFTARLSLAVFLAVTLTALARFTGQLSGLRQAADGTAAFILSPLFLSIALIYLLSHLLRSLRLWTLLIETERSFFRLFRLHMGLSWISLLLPMKVAGDAYRMLELSHDRGRAEVGPFVVIMERFFDAVVLLGLATPACLMYPAMLPEIAPFIAVLASVAALGSMLYWGLPGFLDYSRSLVIRRSRSRWRYVLRWLHHLDRLAALCRRLVRDRILALLLLSLGIWAAEWACVSLLYRHIAAQPWGGWLPVLLKTFSSLLTAKGGTMASLPLYGLMTFLALSAAGLPLWAAYSRLRFTVSRARISEALSAENKYRLKDRNYRKKEVSYG